MTEYQRNTASFCFYGTIQFLVFTDFDILSYIWYRLGKVVYNADRIFVRIYKNLIYLQSFNFAAGITKNPFYYLGDSIRLMMGILFGIVTDLA